MQYSGGGGVNGGAALGFGGFNCIYFVKFFHLFAQCSFTNPRNFLLNMSTSVTCDSI